MANHEIGLLLRDMPQSAAPASSPCAACSVRELSVCAVLDGDELSELASISHDCTLDAGETLFSEGDGAEHVYNVTAGWVKLYKLLPDGRRQITGFLTAGDFLGLAAADTWVNSAEAVTGIALCRFSRRRLDGLMQQFPHLQRRLLSMAAGELALAQDQMLLLGRKTAKEKICSFLLSLSRRARLRGHADNPIYLPMGRADIGDYLGLTMETVSRTFTQLKTAGIISLLDGHQVQLTKRDVITELAENG
jgi:CRP/FNR family transcriptional regulator, anaerobic regulatory protein